jgi:hypothetical protein
VYETLIQQALNWEGGVVFIPLAFGLAVGLGYVLISAARHKRKKWLKWHSELQYASKCVVGEAYGYSSRYTDDCNECYTICIKFLYYFTLCMQENLESNKQNFVKHWNEEHNNGISLLLGHAEKHADK